MKVQVLFKVKKPLVWLSTAFCGVPSECPSELCVTGFPMARVMGSASVAKVGMHAYNYQLNQDLSAVMAGKLGNLSRT